MLKENFKIDFQVTICFRKLRELKLTEDKKIRDFFQFVPQILIVIFLSTCLT